jgi:prepilin-type N-terminal cleavage/methylation domain-containing protein
MLLRDTSKRCGTGGVGQRGFTAVELVIVTAITLILSAIAIPNFLRLTHTYRLRSDGDGLVSLLMVGRMRGAAKFAHAQVSCDTTSTACPGAGLCTLSMKQYGVNTYTAEKQQVCLSPGISFGYPASTPNGGTPPGQSGAGNGPYQGRSGQTNPYTITFNSRGLPIDDTSGSSVGNYAFYLKDAASNTYVAIGIDSSGRASLYTFAGSSYWELAE